MRYKLDRHPNFVTTTLLLLNVEFDHSIESYAGFRSDTQTNN